MSKNVSILLVGIGGYGNVYVDELIDCQDKSGVYIAGVIDPKPESCNKISIIREMKIPIYNSMDEFYAVSNADLVVISSPIQYHCEQTCYALSMGSNVLCEKPICATVQDALEMIKASEQSGKFLAIGYQWSFSNAIIELKKDIINGVFGKPKKLKTIVLWPRDEQYFSRGWAGKKRDSRGEWVLDSVANNATAHYLHNMFYILGEQIESSARPVKVTAELYRANNIENFDTTALRSVTEKGVEIYFYATHAVKDLKGPDFCYEFERAFIEYQHIRQYSGDIIAKFADGTIKSYGDPMEDDKRKLWTCVNAIREGASIPCPAKAAISHTICINGMHDSMPDICNFPENFIKKEGEIKTTWVEGLDDVMQKCFESCKLPSETDTSWAKAGKTIDLKGYNFFNGGIV